MAKYSVECATCGCSLKVQLFGKIKDREWALDNRSFYCDDCKEKYRIEQREKKLAEAEQTAKENGLPELTGTEKQIKWAETIRAGLIKDIEYFISGREINEKGQDAINYIYSQEKSHWWIENREQMPSLIIKNAIESVEKEKQLQIKQIAENIPEAKDAKIEATIRPENVITETIAEIKVSQELVSISFVERNEAFREIVKSKGFSWGNIWERKITNKSGSAIDRAADIANKLLASGFVIRCFNAEVREKAISGNFEHECKKWILARTDGEYQGWFAINWTEGDYYDKAKKIKSAKWVKPSIIVKPENYEQVLDFAEMYDFKLSSGALLIVEKMKTEKEVVMTVNIEEKKKAKPAKKQKPDASIPVEVDESLRA